MRIEAARRLARLKALAHRPFIVAAEEQTDDAWVFTLGDPDGRTVDANLPIIVIDKEGHGMREVRLPSPEGFALLGELRPL